MNCNIEILACTALYVHGYIEYITWYLKTSFDVAVNWILTKKIEFLKLSIWQLLDILRPASNHLNILFSIIHTSYNVCKW